MWGTDKPATRNNNDKVAALLNPRNVVILGATDKPGSWTTRVFRNLQRYNFPGKIFPMNPGRDTVWDVKCYRGYGELPEKPDHIVVLVPAAAVPAIRLAPSPSSISTAKRSPPAMPPPVLTITASSASGAALGKRTRSAPSSCTLARRVRPALAATPSAIWPVARLAANISALLCKAAAILTPDPPLSVAHCVRYSQIASARLTAASSIFALSLA